ncbi:hypothetical protein C1E24_13420 [Pseudoalteromonas phenolica]|uniref:Two-component system response regulator n=1 Tax=Pseudoalteromonas phenolica TaxID=161398 RepID=A0A5R9Q0L4_9GAMM|nr:HD domain-containing phosphohydrolase [Pseudoalteromonas phenolica]TLX46364.1 hypothetical protein C1E24_13420 [Pseudoalteromonas phenolica]
MSDKLPILIVDDETQVLNALKRLFRKEFEVTVCDKPLEAVEVLKQREFAVIISDMKMPLMSGAELLSQAFIINPNTARILLTGYSDIDSTALAINEGKISNYVSKPWRNDDLKEIVMQACDQYQLKQSVIRLQNELAEKNKQLQSYNDELESKVQARTSSLSQLTDKLKNVNQKQRKLFHDVIEMINLIIEDTTGSDDGHIKRVASHCRLVAKHMGLEKPLITQAYLAGLMHEIGKVSLPDELVKCTENELTKEQLTAKQQNAIKGAEILQKLPNLQIIGKGILHQYEHYNGTGLPEHLIADNIPTISRILTIVNDYDKLLIGRITGEKMQQDQAMLTMKTLATEFYDPHILDVYFELLSSGKVFENHDIDVCVGVSCLETGMHLTQDLLNKQGAVILTAGTEITPSIIEKLQKYQKDWNYIFNVFVH